VATRIYTIQGPDGRTYDLEGPEGASEAQVIAALQQQLASQPAPKKGVLAQVAKGAESLISSGRTGIGAATGSAEEAALAGLQRGEDINARYADDIGLDKLKDVYDKKGIGAAGKEVLRQIPLAIAEQLPNMGATLGSARLGAMAGTAINPGIGTIVGGTVGALAPSFLTQFGGNVERQAAEQKKAGQPIDINTRGAAGAAVPQAGLEAASQFIPLGGRLVSKLTGMPLNSLFGKTAAQAQKIADERLLTTIAKGTATGVAAELPTELTQTMLERAQAGLSLSSPDAMEEYGRVAYQTSLLGPLGAGGRFSEKAGAREQLEKEAQLKTEEARQAAYTAPAEPQAAAPVVVPPVAPAEAEIAEPKLVEKAAAQTEAVTPTPTAAPTVPTPENTIAATPSESTPAPAADATVIPTSEPELITEQDPIKLMDMYQEREKEAEAIRNALGQAAADADTAKIRELTAVFGEANKKLEALKEAVEKSGGSTAKDFEASANAERSAIDSSIAKNKTDAEKLKESLKKAHADEKFDVMPGLADKLDALEAKRVELEKQRETLLASQEKTRGLLRVQQTPKNETLALFDENTPMMQPSANKDVKPLTTVQGYTSEVAAGPLPREEGTGKVDKAALEAAQVKAAELEKETVEYVKAGPQPASPETIERATQELTAARQKLRMLQEASAAKPSEALDEAKLSAQREVGIATRNLEALGKRSMVDRHLEEVNRKTETLNKAYDEVERLRGGLPKPVHLNWMDSTTDKITSLGNQGNLLRTAIANGDERMIRILKQAEKKNKARAQKGPKQEELFKQNLEKGLGLPGKRVTRVFDDAESNKVMAEIEATMGLINNRQGNAKFSVYEEAQNLYARLQELDAQAKDMSRTPQQRGYSRRSYNIAYKQYDDIVNNKIIPAREKINSLYSNLVKSRKVEEIKSAEEQAKEDKKPRSALSDLSVKDQEEIQRILAEDLDAATTKEEEEAAQKKANKAIAEKKTSKEAKQAANVNEGKNVKADPAKRARELGFETEEYQKFVAPLQKKIDQKQAQLENFIDKAQDQLSGIAVKYGDVSDKYKNKLAAVNAEISKRQAVIKSFAAAQEPMLLAKAEEIGRALPEFRSELVKQTKKVKEAVAEQVAVEPQAPKSKRTKQVTRDVAKMGPTKSFTGSEESRAATAKRQEGFETGLKKARAADVTEGFNKAVESVRERPKPAKTAVGAALETAVKKTRKKPVVYRAAQADAKGMDEAEVKKQIKDIVATWKRGPEIVVMKAPAEAGNATGGLSADNRTMYIYYNNLRGDEDLKATVFHEGLGHFGLRDLFNKRLDGMLEDMYRTNKNIRMAADAWLRDHPEGYREIGENTTARAVEEVLAIYSEGGRQDTSLWNRIKSMVKDFARRIGLKMDYTDADIDHILARAHDQVFESGEIAGAAMNAEVAVHRRPTVYGQNDALSKLSERVVAQPKTLKQQMGTHFGLEAEMNAVDMRAGLRKAMEAGARDLGDTKLFQQAMYSVTKSDQKMPLVLASLSNGPLEVYTDSEGFHGVRSTNQNSAKEVFSAISEIPDSYGDERAKTGLATTYMIAQRAANKGLEKLDYGALGVTEAQLKEAMDSVNADSKLKAALESVRTKYNAYNKGLINFLASTGAISKKLAAELLQGGDYVPYYRVTDNGMAELVFGGDKTINIGDIRYQPYLAELKGGDTKILPLNESLPRNTLLLTDKAMTNMATRNVAYALQTYGKTGDKSLMPIHRGNGPADPRVIRFNQEPDANDPKDDGQRWLRVVTNDTILDGIPAELIVKSLEGAHLTLPSFLKYGAVAGDILRSGVTRTPLYLMRQLFRDPIAATFTTGLDYGPLTAIFKANKEFLNLSAGQSKKGAELIQKGLIQSGIFTGDPDDISKFALQLASGKSMSAIDKLCAMADKAAMNADAATRSLIYENAIKNGLSEVQADMAVMESMNFYKRGLNPNVQYAARLIPFFNAQIQGLNVLYKAARGQMPYNEQLKIKRKFMNNAMMLMGVGMVYAMAMDDNEYYKNAKPKDRYSNFFLPLPGVDEPLKLPIPYEAGWFFSLAVAAVDGMKAETNTEQQLRALKDMFVGAIPGATSMGVPQIVKPIAEVWTNKNFFSGNAIESQSMLRRDPLMRYNANTTEFAKFMAEYVPVLSPIQIEHITKGYFGQLPIAAMAAVNGLFSKNQGVEPPAKRASDMPLIGSAFQRKFGGEDAEVTYRYATEATQAKNTYTELASTGQREEAKQYLEAHRAEIVSARAATAYEKIMGQLRKRETIVRESKLDEDKKREQLDKIDEIRQKQSERYKALFEKVEAKYSD